MSGDLLVLARGTMSPGRGRPDLRLSSDHVSMTRDDAGSVRSSRRSPGADGGEAAVDTVRGLLSAAAGALGPAPAQSVLAEVRELPGLGWRQFRILARIETSLGPLFTGLAKSCDATGSRRAPDISSGLNVPPYGLRPGEPPRGWRALPLVMRPAVAAIPTAGTALLLGSRTARARTTRLDGRRLLGRLTLTDLPSAHPPAMPDDAGHPADAIRLVEDGVLTPLRIEAASGAPRGRAVWDHDRQALRPAPQARLRLSVPSARAPDVSLELQWPIESLRRYDPDGLLSLSCVAHASDQPERCFAVRLRARPQTILRAVRGAVADTEAVACADADVTTPPLLLPTARDLEAKGRCTVETL